MHTDELVAALRAAADSDGFGPERVTAILGKALAHGPDWPDERHRRVPDGEESALYPLHQDPDGRFSVVAAVFRPGFPTTVHDHGAWAVIAVLHGRERETWFRRVGDGPLERELRVDSPAGSVRIVPHGVIHTVEALGDENAVSVHVYGTDILTQPRSAYDVDSGRVSPYAPQPTPPV